MNYFSKKRIFCSESKEKNNINRINLQQGVLKMYSKDCRGFTILELLVAITLFSIVGSIPVYYYRSLAFPSDNAAIEVVSFYKAVRAQAISATNAYLIQPSSSDTLEVSYRSACDSTEAWTLDTNLTLELSQGADFQATDWFVCIDSRGFPDANIDFQIIDQFANTVTIEIFYGGQIDIV